MARVLYEDLRSAAAAAGLACRGGFHPQPQDGVPQTSGGAAACTLVLFGLTGSMQWPPCAASAEFADGEPHPLDRWSRRVLDALAARFGATALYPGDGPPWLPFQRWARRAEAVHPSPLGILIHPQFGLWHSYRGALAFADRLGVPQPEPAPHPCERCAERPCLSACPVQAFSAQGFDRERCAAHLRAQPHGACMRGCLARASCPVGAEYRQEPTQAAFHMNAFLRG